MAGKRKQKRRLSDETIVNPKTTSEIILNQLTSQRSVETIKLRSPKRKSRHRLIVRSRSPSTATLSKKSKSKVKSKSDNSDTCPNSSSVDSETGSHISKRRRRETRSSLSEHTSEPPPSTSSNHIESNKSRRRRTVVVPHLDENKSSSTADNSTMASSSSQRTNNDGASHSINNPSKNCLPSTSRGKRNNNSSKNKSKFPQFSISSHNDASLFLSGDSNFQGIVSSGMDISHFQNYLSSRSLTTTEIGDQINKKLDELRSVSSDKTQEYMLISEINQHLLVSYEDSLNSLRVGELVSQVVALIQNCEDNLVDLKNICYNVLLHLMEALPRSSDYLVSSLTMFLNKITNLFDFDSLEQIINVIERVSRRHGQAVLQCGAFTIILNYYDFLTAPQQLTILNMISQCFINLKPSDFNYVIDGIENLSNRLKQSEPKCVEKVIQCFVRLVNAFQTDESKLKKIASPNLFSNLQELLISSPPVIVDIHEIVQMMAVLCANCPDLAVDLIKQNITQTILCVCNSVMGDSSTIVSNCSNRSVEEILALVNLISELMPPLPINDDLFIINRLIGTAALCKQSRNSSSTDHAWYWYNASAKQWISHQQNVCQLLEKTLNSSEFEISCQSNDTNMDINLITMEQTHSCNGVMITSDLKRLRHQAKQAHKTSADLRVDARLQLLQEQCLKFENNELSESVEAIDLMRHLFPLVIDIYNEASSHQVRYKCLEAMIRMIYPTTNKALNGVLNKAALSSLMASLLSSQDSTILINSIQMGTIIKKLPSTLILNFKKEGVLHQLDRMLSTWKDKMCDMSSSRNHSTSLLSAQSNISMTVSAPPGSLDQLNEEHTSDYTSIRGSDRHQQHNRSDIIKIDQSMDRLSDSAQLSTSSSTNNSTHRFTNWIMKRSGCIGRTVSTDANTQASGVKTRKHRIETEQALDMSVKNTTEQVNQSTSVSTNRRINQIMTMLNLNSSLSNVYHPYDNKTDKSSYDNPKRELFCKQWILKFGTKLDLDWKQIGDESINEKISSISASSGPKKDIIYYLKEIVSGLRTDNITSIKKALTLYVELLATDCYISVFEMETSCLNDVLLEFFTRPSSIETKRDHFLIFIEVFSNNNHSSPGDYKFKKPFAVLVNHLLMCLHQQEQFHVRTSQLPATSPSTIDSAASRTALQSRYTLTQVLTDAVLGRISSRNRIENPSLLTSRNFDPSMFEARLIPNLLLEHPTSRSGNKVTDIHCHFSPYPTETHVTDAENGFEFWNGGELIGFNSSFSVTLDVLGTVLSIEKIVMREISRHRRINKRFGIVSKELASINDSSDSDDDYDCDAVNESLLSGEIDYQDDVSDFADINFTGNATKKHESVSEKLNSFNLFHMNSASQASSKSKSSKKSHNKHTVVSNNPLSKIRESGLKALSNKRATRQSQNDSESLAITPSTSSGCSSSLATSVSQATTSKSLDLHSKYLPEVVMKPISKIQILIGDVILPPEMTLYQAIRRYSNHITQFMINYKDGKTDQEIEEAINQIIWKSEHNIHYRPVSSLYHLESLSSSRQGFRANNTESISTFNFMASLLNSHNHKFSHFPAEHTKPLIPVQPVPLIPVSSITTRQRTFHRKLANAQMSTVVPDIDHTQITQQPLRHKRRRKNNTDAVPTIGRSAVNSHNVLIESLTKHLPYPTLIDFPTIFEPIPVGKIHALASESCQLHHDLNSNMSQKLETTLALLRCLYFINRNWHVLNFSLNSNTLIPEIEFRSQKLSSKANRQLQDTFYVLARNIPFWCVQLFHTCAFLFSLETRQNFLYLFNFDRARTLLYLEGAASQDSDALFDSSSSDIRRIRVQVNRSDRLLEESELLLKNHSDPRILLEISFNNEAGFGLGPTNEFYTQVSKCLMKNDLTLWYSSAETAELYVMPPPAGLYPRPIFNKNKKLDNKIRNKFVFLGRFMARALLDCRKIDIPLNPVFYKWLLGQEETINSADIYHIDPNLASQLKSLHDIVNRHLKIETGDQTISISDKKEACDQTNVEDLQIVFVHPIYTNIELVKDGANRVVTIDDLSLYLDLIASFTLIDGVRTQMECVLEGFDSLLPGARMHLAALFEAHEMEEIFCGGRVEDNHAWDVKTLTECCVCDHGYTMNSKSIVNLFEIMSEFTKEQRRYFVQFCTGTPRLPVGGFRALKPPFKIVNKKEGGENPDNYLPSVMTCQNFLKLPDYSSKMVMHERMLYALHEGQNAFYLS